MWDWIIPGFIPGFARELVGRTVVTVLTDRTVRLEALLKPYEII